MASLLREIERIDGEFWIRLLYTHPAHWSDELIATIAECRHVARYIDIPLQHIDESMLRRMRRETSRAHIETLIAKLRAGIPGVALRTTFIAGFPGETDDDFAQLQDFVKTIGFDHVGVFTYSHEEGTSAHGLEDDVPAKVKTQRQSRLMSLQKQIVAKAQQLRVGQQVRLLVDGPSSEHELVLRARLEGHAPDIDPVVYLTDCDPSDFSAGQFIQAEIVGSREYDLIAAPCAVSV